mgnify:CR=1 FL=1
MDDELIAAHRDLPELMPYLHLPVQSGSDSILKSMNRRHTAAEYYEIIDRIRSARPDMALSGDFIVGFPGETDADFAATVEMVKKIGYASAFSFKYSARPGTPGAQMDNQIEEHVKAERLEILQVEITRQSQAFNAACVGMTLPVLIEKPGRNPGQVAGRSPYLQAVHISAGQDLIGQILQVEIIGQAKNSLEGRIVTADRIAV